LTRNRNFAQTAVSLPGRVAVLLLSASTHCLVAWALLHFMTRHPPTSQTASHSEAVKLSVYMKSPSKPARPYHGKVPLPRRKMPMTTVAKQNAVDSKISALPRISKYASLFPKPAQDLFTVDEGIVKPATATEVKSPSADTENDSISDTVKNSNYSELKSFANQVAQGVYVPPALDKVTKGGTAALRFSRGQGDNWSVAAVDGDPYFRAILYEAVRSISDNNIGLIQLSSSELNSVRIVFDFQSRTVIGLAEEMPIEIRVYGNIVHLTKIRQTNDERWQMLATSPGGGLAINLVGVALFGGGYLNDPRMDTEIRKIRLSPAFTSPLGR
jgi:hypothetical protein